MLRERSYTLLFQAGLMVLIVMTGAAVMAGRGHEQGLAARILENLDHGRPVWLEAGGREFLGLYSPVFGARPRRAVLLVHGMGAHPDWPEVILPLRTRLPDHGWSTLSLQMPVLAAGDRLDDYGATVPEAMRRIAAGVDYLRARDYASIVIAGYGFGAAGALAYLAEHPDADGLVTVGVLAREFLQPPIDPAGLIERISVPVLDVYGGRDFPDVIRSAQDRRHAARSAGNPDFTQTVVEGADHYFSGQEVLLVGIVADWLNQLPAGSGTPESREMADNP